jgi:hypothetical protein
MKSARVAAPRRESIGRARPQATRREHPLEWLVEPVRDDPGVELKPLFGGRTLKLDGKHQLFLTTQGEPWQGLLVCTFHEHQPSLLAEFPALSPHPVLGKWLYLPEAAETFERDAKRLVQLVRSRDPRIGVPSSSRRKKTAAKKIRFGDKL